MTRHPALILLVATLTACGVSGSTPLADLSEAQRTSVCRDVLTSGPPAGDYDCGDGVVVRIEDPDQAECEVGLAEFAANCPELVVDDVLGCFDAQADADVCADEAPAECDALFDCILGG
jgi:hypothetical protein